MAGNEEPRLLTEHEIAVLKNLGLAEEMLAASENWISGHVLNRKIENLPALRLIFASVIY
jgi:hypothetical protein